MSPFTTSNPSFQEHAIQELASSYEDEDPNPQDKTEISNLPLQELKSTKATIPTPLIHQATPL